jgi:signal transduction histidine kinase
MSPKIHSKINSKQSRAKIQEFWEKLLIQHNSLSKQLTLQFALGAIGFFCVTLVYHWTHIYTPSITLVTSMLIVLVGEIASAIILILALTLLSDYFYIPPTGSIFDSRASFEHFLVISFSAAVVSLLISSLRSAFLHSITARREAQQATSDAELASNSMERTLALISHDVRNPLSSIKTTIQLIQRYKDNPEKVDQLARRNIDDLERIDLMIQTLLDVSRIRAGQTIPLQFEYCDLQTIVSRTTEDLTFSLGSRIRSTSSKPIFGIWSKDGIRRAIENLVTNAAKYGASDTPITVGVIQESGQVRISVHNEGNEIPAEQQARLFDPYQRGPEESRRKGWGLGLALVKGVSEAHGGNVEVKSMPGQGTTFTLVLPLKMTNP